MESNSSAANSSIAAHKPVTKHYTTRHSTTTARTTTEQVRTPSIEKSDTKGDGKLQNTIHLNLYDDLFNLFACLLQVNVRAFV